MKIKKIEYTNKFEDVYDIEVPEYHNYALKNGVIVHNCAGWSLRQLLREGFNGVAGRVASRPPKHFREALGQMANFLGILQSEWAGAQAFSSFDTYLAPYVFMDQLSDKEIKKAIKQFVYNLNVPSRWGQSPFTNVTLDITVPKDLRDNIPMIKDNHLFDHIKDEKRQELLQILQQRNPSISDISEASYKDFVQEMEKIVIAYYEIMTEGDKHGQPFTFPIPTVNITDDFKWDGDVADALFTNTAKVGSSYFQNFVGSQFKLDENGKKVENPEAYKPDAVRSMCMTGDSVIEVKLSGKNKVEKRTIGDVLENYDIDDIEIKTSQGFRHIEEKFIYDVNENLVKITLEDGKTLTTTKEHPHLVYTVKNDLRIVKAEFLYEGMEVSTKRLYNPHNKGVPMDDTMKTRISKTKKDGFLTGKYKKMVGELNSMFGKSHSKDSRQKISESLMNHEVSDNCRQKSSERWSGLNNPVAHQSFWDRRDFSYNNQNISPYEKIIFDELQALDIPFVHQKVFNDEQTNKTYVADFYLPEKNTVLEIDSQCDEKVYINERPSSLRKEKFDFYQAQGLDVITFNAQKCNTYRTHINNTQKIVKIEMVPFVGKVYDVRIKQKENGYTVNDFFANDILTHNCCRLQLDLRELQKRGNGLFGSAELTGCYDDQTEVLTFNGWKLFKDVTKDDKVLSMNTETKQPEWVPVDETHEYHVNDDLMYFNRRGIEELAVTPNHRMVRTDRNGKIKIERADAVFSERKEYMVPSSNPILSSIDPELVQVGSYNFDASVWYKFLGIFIGDGYCRHEPANGNIHAHYEVIIAQRDTSEQYEEIKDVINSLGIKFTSNHRGFMIYDKEISNELSKYGKAVDKHAPKELFGYSNALIEQFITGLRLTDYSKGYFYTVSKQLKDDIQTLLTLLGKHSYSRVGKHAGHQSTTTDGRLVNAQYDCYEINEMVIVNKSFMKKECETRHYEGMVYCLTVKHGTVCVRRNGAINWSGNSVGVVTINMARLGYRFANNLEGLMQELDRLLDNAKSTLEKKRVFITQLFDRGLYPYSKRYLPSFKNHFSTIGVNGMNEMVRNFTNDKTDIASEFGKKMSLDILNHIREKMKHYQEETGNLYNLEATPAEGTTYRFAKEDYKRFNGIIQAGTYPNIYYTNSSQLPVEYTDDPFKALDHQNECQTAYNGGTVLHMYMNEAIDSPDSCKKFVKTIIDNYQLPYITISPVFSVCETHGYLRGQHETCPKCGKKTDTHARVMGYLRPIQSYNIGKRGEFKDRKWFIQPSDEQLETIKK